MTTLNNPRIPHIDSSPTLLLLFVEEQRGYAEKQEMRTNEQGIKEVGLRGEASEDERRHER